MKKVRNIATVGLTGFYLFIFYIILLHVIEDPRIIDGDLTLKEMNLIENSVFLGSMIVAQIFWIFTIYKTYESRRFGWMAFVLLVWPLYPIYLWKFSDERETQY